MTVGYQQFWPSSTKRGTPSLRAQLKRFAYGTKRFQLLKSIQWVQICYFFILALVVERYLSYLENSSHRSNKTTNMEMPTDYQPSSLLSKDVNRKTVILASSATIALATLAPIYRKSRTQCYRILLAFAIATMLLLSPPMPMPWDIKSLVLYSAFPVFLQGVTFAVAFLQPPGPRRWAATGVPLTLFTIHLVWVFNSNVSHELSGLHLFSVHGFLIGTLSATSQAFIEKFEIPEEWAFKDRLLAAYKQAYNVRRIGLSNQAPDNRHHNKRNAHKPPQARLDFFLERLFGALLCWKMVDEWYSAILYALGQSNHYKIVHVDQAGVFRRFCSWMMGHSATMARSELIEEIHQKAVTVLGFWGWSVVVMIGIHCFLGLLFVNVLRLDEPHEWPPLFHSPMRATSLRAFWREFWHSMLYRGSVEYSKMLVFRGLRIQPGSNLATHAMRASVFVITTLFHVWLGYYQHSECDKAWDETIWWGRYFVAMMLEEVVRQFSIDYVNNLEDGRQKRILRWGLEWVSPWVGRVWVLAFNMWIVPKVDWLRMDCYNTSWI